MIKKNERENEKAPKGMAVPSGAVTKINYSHCIRKWRLTQ